MVAGACVAAEDTTDLADAATCGGASFTAGTKVLLASGVAIPISQLKPGDKVLATNTKTGRNQAETVTAVLLHHDTDRYDLTVRTSRGSAVIQTTSSHLFRDVTQRRWVKAAALNNGDTLRTASGTTATAAGGHVPATASGWMWDLTVPGNGDHDFYIDTTVATILVHNCPVGPDDNPAENPNMGSLNKVPDSQLSDQVGDIHEFKAEILGRGAQLSRFNVYVDKSTGYLFLMARGGDPIPTYFNIGGG
jgi:Pretoxin HINT domain